MAVLIGLSPTIPGDSTCATHHSARMALLCPGSVTRTEKANVDDGEKRNEKCEVVLVATVGGLWEDVDAAATIHQPAQEGSR